MNYSYCNYKDDTKDNERLRKEQLFLTLFFIPFLAFLEKMIKENLVPLVEDLRIDLMVIAKDLRVIGVKLKGANMNLMAYKLFTNADKLDSYVGRLE